MFKIAFAPLKGTAPHQAVFILIVAFGNVKSHRVYLLILKREKAVSMTIRKASQKDLPFLLSHDRHIAADEIRSVVSLGRMLVLEEEHIIGWLRWNLFWDNTPFMNMLYFLEGERGKGFGRQLVSHWEALMKAAGYALVMTSTQSDETAQHFYRRLGYVDSGALLLKDEPLEIILTKVLR